MSARYRLGLLPFVLCMLIAAGCGGGGGGGTDGSGGPTGGGSPSGGGSTGGTGGTGGGGTTPPVVSGPAYVKLTSDPGEFIGGGRSFTYSKSNSVITIAAQGSRLSVEVQGDESWHGDFQLPNTYSNVQAGTFNGLKRYPFHDPAIGGLSWGGEGRGCNTLTGTFTIRKVVYDGESLAELDLQFTQYCEGGALALHGDFYWNAKDTTSPPGPVAPPTGLWQPAAGLTPASGNFVYLESQPTDYVGAGGIYLYTPSNAVVAVNGANAHLSVGINGDQQWAGDFQAMYTLGRLEVGYYAQLGRSPSQNPAKGGLNWSGEGRGCSVTSGWFVVDSVTYSGTDLTAIDLRFEQHCDGATAALRGKIHWNANDSTLPPGPTTPPAGLWQPSPGVTPASINYVYLESEPGDFIGAGRNHLYTQADAVLAAATDGARFAIAVTGDESWSGEFQGMNALTRLEPGFYDSLERYPFHNPAKGGLDWSGEGRGCNTLTGWFVVDSVTYSGATLVSIELRFEQHCGGGSAALRGKIHWTSNDTTAPPGPVAPPAGLWQPSTGATPTAGNYVYLESQPGDFVGAGGTYLYTQADAVLTATPDGAHLTVGVIGDKSWGGQFAPMSTLSRLQVGYYGDLGRFPFQNPAKGGLSWTGDGRGCNTLSGWFVVDAVTYSGSTLASIDLRFEQHCEGAGPALRGKVHWAIGDPISPPGPTTAPAGLWQPGQGVTPATGSYVYLESQAGDFIGQGRNYLYAPGSAAVSVGAEGGLLQVVVNNPSGWTGRFQTMNVISRLQVGYYGNLQRYPFHNPTKGGLDWSGEGRGCNTLSGWFVVDAVTYTGTTLTSIDLRFEQHCEGVIPALRGKIHWSL